MLLIKHIPLILHFQVELATDLRHPGELVNFVLL